MDQRIQKKLRDQIDESFQLQVAKQDDDPAEVPIQAAVVVLPVRTFQLYDQLVRTGLFGRSTEEAFQSTLYRALRNDYGWLLNTDTLAKRLRDRARLKSIYGAHRKELLEAADYVEYLEARIEKLETGEKNTA